MSRVYVSAAEAAQILGVHPQRIHQRIREGSLSAEKIGNQWAVEMDDLRRIRSCNFPGRPLSAKSAWDLLAVGAAKAVSELSPSARSRARARLRDLVDKVSEDDDLDSAAARLVHALRNRAERVLYVASPRDLPDVRDDMRVHLSGVSLPESNIAAGEVVEAYVSVDERNDLLDEYLLSPGSRDRANVIFHVVPAELSNPALASLDDMARSPLARAADLAEHDGVREKAEAVRSVADLRASLLAERSGVVGADRW